MRREEKSRSSYKVAYGLKRSSHAAFRGRLQRAGVAHVDGRNADDLGARPDQGDVGGAGFCFLHVTPDDACVSTERDEGPDLHGADGAGAAGAEEDFIGVEAISPDGGEELLAGNGHGGVNDGEEELEDALNGEEVERKTRRLQWVEFVRMGVSGVGFAMGVVGIWGDGALGLAAAETERRASIMAAADAEATDLTEAVTAGAMLQTAAPVIVVGETRTTEVRSVEPRIVMGSTGVREIDEAVTVLTCVVVQLVEDDTRIDFLEDDTRVELVARQLSCEVVTLGVVLWVRFSQINLAEFP
nr:hypothetical protein CFP56_08011 [Quercus suber]